MTQYQALLLDQLCIQFYKTSALNPAILLPDNNPPGLLHDCLEVTDPIQSIKLDLTGVPLVTLDEALFTDGSSFIRKGQRRAGEQ